MGKINNSFLDSDHISWIKSLRYAVAAVLIYAFFVSILLPLAGGHPWGLLGFSRKFALNYQTQVPERFISSEFGYDGQAYFILSLYPFVRDPSTLGFRLDNQALRQQRILYPLIIHLLAGGDSSRSAWCMVILNVMAIGVIVALSLKILCRMGQPAWLSLLVGFYPGLAVSVTRGLTEPICLMWILAAISAWKQRPLLAGFFLGLAVLTRETALLVAAGFGCAWLLGIIKKNSSAPSASIWVLPLAAYLLWHGFLYFWVTGASVAGAASTNMGWPMAGILQALKKLLIHPDSTAIFFLFFIAITFIWQIFIATTIKFKSNPLFPGWILYGVLLSVAGLDIWDNSPALLRVASEWNLTGLLLLADSKFYKWKPVAAVWMSAWFFSAAGEWYRYGLIGF
jgi:hypothetical protein